MLEVDCIPHVKTNAFSALNIDYLNERAALKPFYQYQPNDEGLQQAIEDRKAKPVDRATLVSVLHEQYQGLEIADSVRRNIDLLLRDNTFTICTAHQPNLLTGYLYFIYKILHAVKLAEHCSKMSPHHHFVPIFYMGSEDNDIDELGVFHYGGNTYRWNTEQTGAVGRMQTADLGPLIDSLLNVIGPPGANAEHLKHTIIEAYKQHHTIAAATRYLINVFLGKYGVIVLDPDHARLKKAFFPIMQQELVAPKADALVKATSEALNKHYTAQAYARPINLFYLSENIRERIEATAQGWHVVNTNIKWDQEADLLQELALHPERFSPNVILRGLYQETILPNVAFIGGGSEVAYWMQLKTVFEQYQVFFPLLVLRQSMLWMDAKSVLLQKRLKLSNEELFLSLENLVSSYVHQHTQHDLQLDSMWQQLEVLMQMVKEKATVIDSTLQASVEAAITKIKHQIKTIERKMVRAEKRKMGVELGQVNQLMGHLFPKHKLQERYETFMPFYLQYGPAFFDTILHNTKPFGNTFLIVKDTEHSYL
jgi:bacillithiol biosynthesis cysteine-adding enzyme BshC